MPNFIQRIGAAGLSAVKGGAIPFPQSYGMQGTAASLALSGGDPARFWERLVQNGLSGGTDSYDVDLNAGDIRFNSLITALQVLQTNSFNEAPPIIRRRDSRGRWQYDNDHPILDLIEYPSENRTRIDLFADTLYERMHYGNSYWYIVTNAFGEPVKIISLIPEEVYPKHIDGSSKEIDYYEYRPVGVNKVYKLPVKSVVHFRSELRDPHNRLLGRSRLSSLKPEICVDKEDSLATAHQAHNLGAPGAIIAPKNSDDAEIDSETARKIESDYIARTSGRKRGRPLVMTEAVDVIPFGVKPSEMATDRAISKAIVRIFNAYSIHPVLLDPTVSKGNLALVKEAQEMMWEMSILPIMTQIGSTITCQLLTYYEKPNRNTQVFFDLRCVRALQPDIDRLHQRVRDDWRFNGINLNEFLDETDRDMVEEDLGKMRYSEFVAAQARVDMSPGGGTQMLPTGGGSGSDPSAHQNDGGDPVSSATPQYGDPK